MGRGIIAAGPAGARPRTGRSDDGLAAPLVRACQIVSEARRARRKSGEEVLDSPSELRDPCSGQSFAQAKHSSRMFGRTSAFALAVLFVASMLAAQGLADPLLFAWALNFTAWAEILGSRFAEAARDLEDAMQIVERLQITWLRADTSCAQALIESIQGDFDKAAERARSLLSADVRLALPAVEAVATEVLGGIAFMTGRYRDASALFERAHLLYVSHHLVHGWGFLMQIERSEALLLQADEEGPDAVPALSSRLREHARLIERRLGGLPSYRGCALVLRGVYAARRGRPNVARRLFEQALHLRPPPRTTYIDGWVLWRIAFERHRLGEPAASVQPLLKQVEDINARSGMHGMAQFLTRARGLYGV